MALNASKPTQVTELTREQVATILTKPLEQASVFLAAGPTIHDTTGPLRIPSAPAPADADALEWVGESELIPEPPSVWQARWSRPALGASVLRAPPVAGDVCTFSRAAAASASSDANAGPPCDGPVAATKAGPRVACRRRRAVQRWRAPAT